MDIRNKMDTLRCISYFDVHINYFDDIAFRYFERHIKTATIKKFVSIEETVKYWSVTFMQNRAEVFTWYTLPKSWSSITNSKNTKPIKVISISLYQKFDERVFI